MGAFNPDGSLNKSVTKSSSGRVNWDNAYAESSRRNKSRYTAKQREDNGFDFYKDDQKTTIEEFAKNREVDVNAFRGLLAKYGDKQSTEILTKQYYEGQPIVKEFNSLDVSKQRDRLRELQKAASRTELNTVEDRKNRDWARGELKKLAAAGVEKGGNVETFVQDMLGGDNFKNVRGESVPGVVDTYKRVAQGNARVIDDLTVGSQRKLDESKLKNTETMTKLRQLLIDKYSQGPVPNGNITDRMSPDDKKLYEAITSRLDLTLAELGATSEKIQEEVDPTKYAGAAAQVGLDALTAGVGGRVIGEGIKGISKSTVAKGFLGGGVVGGGYGAGVTAEQFGSDATAQDYLMGVGAGAALGGLVGGIVPTASLIKKLNSGKKIAPNSPDGKLVAQGVTQLGDDLIAAAGAEKNKYKRNAIGSFVQKVKETLNVTYELRKLDVANARKQGINVSKLKKTESLEALYDGVINYKGSANVLMTKKMSSGESVTSVMQKHANDEEAFNNYRNALAEKVARSKGVKFREALSDTDLNDIIKSYEKVNKDARKDIRTINEALNEARANARVSGAISEELDKKIGNSKDYTPVTVVDEGAPKVKVGGKSIVRGDQQFVKALTSAADRPLDVSFQSVQNYIDKAYKNAAEARLSQGILKAHKAGLIKGSRVVSEVGAKQNKAILRNYSKQLNKEATKLQNKVKITTRQAKVIAKEINTLNKKGLLKSLKGLDERTPLNTSDPIKLIKALVNSQPGEVLRIQKSIALREPRLAAKLNEVLNLQDDMSALKSEARGARQASSEILDDPTTGKSFIRGVDENGLPYSLELPPDLTSLLRGVDINPSSTIMKALLNVQRTFQTFWTGFASPIFNFITTPLYDVAANINSLIDNPAAFARSFTPEAFGKAFKGVFESDDYQRALRSAGATPQGGSLMPQDVAKTAESIISRRNFKSRAGYLLKTPKEVLHALDTFSGKLGNVTRTRISRGYYKDALKKGMSETEALAGAAYAFNNMAPNFQRLNSLSRDANAFIPYFTASIAGNRSMWQPILAHPGRAAAVYGGIASTFIGATAYNLSTEAGREFYKQMHEAGNDYVLNGNYVIVLPTASYNPDTGEWSGIIKVPIAPEHRYINQLASGSTEQAVTGDSNLDPIKIASALVNTMTGGIPESVLQGPQIIRVAQILAGGKPTNNILTPDPLIPSWMADLPKEEQTYPWTSNPAKFFSEITGRTISPIQADQIIKQFGSVGRAATGQDLGQQLTGKFSGSFTETLKSKAYRQTEDYKKLSTDIKNNSGGTIEGARSIAEKFNEKVDSVIMMVQDSKMSDATKKELIDNLTKRKASLKSSALEKRLE